MTIEVLPEDVILKIAAGEVIERPASVVKELLENALDAKATKVQIEIEEDKIKITDDGSGMTKEDLKLSYFRHATSKLKQAEDLFNIRSLGFRGEALASVAAVSLLEITSKTKDAQTASKIIIEGGKEISFSPAPLTSNSGTQITVQNLFFNTPARKKYMKTQSTERRAIGEVVANYMLAYENVSFTYIVDNKIQFQAPKTAKLKERYYHVHKSDAKEMITLDEVQNNDVEQTRLDLMQKGITVSGLISTPKIYRKSRNDQILFVNNRLIKSGTIYSAIQNAYKGYLNTGECPLVVLKVTVDPKKIDVNVHPTKQELKFEDDQTMYRAVYYTILSCLRATDLTRTLSAKDIQKENQETLLQKPSSNEGVQSNEPILPPSTKQAEQFFEKKQYQFEKSNAKPAQTEMTGKSFSDVYAEQTMLRDSQIIKQTAVDTIVSDKNQDPIRVIGLFNRTFIVAENLNEQTLVIIDFHAAAEIVNYEKFSKQYEEGVIDSQKLISPEVLELSYETSHILIEHKELLQKLGFDIDDFGDGSILLRSIPTLFGKVIDKQMLLDIADDIKSEKKVDSLTILKDKIITRMSCKASEKAGDDLTIVQAQKILSNLFRLKKNSYNCPHGRPTIVEFSQRDLEKMFKRIR